jgi:hypothetical protein
MKMKVTIQVENIRALKEALKSKCDEIRFGSEFCEWKIPRLESLKKAYALVTDHQKPFVYVTPRVSNEALAVVREQLTFLDDNGAQDIVINDLGVLNIVESFSNLKPCLGRQLVYMPARSPWKQITRTASDASTKKHVEQIFYQTALNYPLTSRFFQQIGVNSIDVDYFPESSPYFKPLIHRGFLLSVHLYLVPVTLTRKCHTARFLGEESPTRCTKPCNEKTFLLKQRDLGMELYLRGNVVFRVQKPSGREFKRLRQMTGVKFVISMDPIQQLESRQTIHELIEQLQPKRFRFWSRI